MQKLWAGFAWVSDWLGPIDKKTEEFIKHGAQIYQKLYNVVVVSDAQQNCNSIVK